MGKLKSDHGLADQAGDQEKKGPKNMTIGDQSVTNWHYVVTGWSPMVIFLDLFFSWSPVWSARLWSLFNNPFFYS